jgi:hypothetical protein
MVSLEHVAVLYLALKKKSEQSSKNNNKNKCLEARKKVTTVGWIRHY